MDLDPPRASNGLELSILQSTIYTESLRHCRYIAMLLHSTTVYSTLPTVQSYNVNLRLRRLYGVYVYVIYVYVYNV